MLNKELLQFNRSGGRISCKFIAEDKNNLELAETLLSIYHQALQEKWPREELEENLEPFVKGSGRQKLSAGMNKLICDHCSFTVGMDWENAARQRETFFKKAAELLKKPPENVEEYRQMVWEACCEKADFPPDIYGDLPEFDRLTAVPQWSAGELCKLYNTALVQGLLLYAGELEVTLSDTDAMSLRKFMRRLKFYRLLAEVQKISDFEVKLVLSGPAAIFGESRKYGLQLAAFFPVILLLKNWKIRAELYLRENSPAEILSLSSGKCHLHSSVRRWAACVPEEVTMFVKSFRQQAEQWQEAPQADWPQIAGYGKIFPDFSFTRADAPELVAHVELFHRYSKSGLTERLDFLQQNRNFPLIVGIDRSLLGKDGEKELLQRYPELPDFAFFYSNYPGVDRVRRMLDKIFERCSSLPLE